MKKLITASALAGLSFAMATTVLAADPNAAVSTTQTSATTTANGANAVTPTIPMSKVIEILRGKNYVIIREIDFEQGVFQAKVWDAKGNKIKAQVNPQTGEVTTTDTAQPQRITIDAAVQKVEAAGYNISKVESEKDKFEVNATDKTGKKVELEVDAKTGEIKED